jgi:RecB family exonuclease
LYDPNSKTAFNLSRSKIENYLRCPRCFYLDRRFGIDVPPTPGYPINSAIDFLLKKEFDILRKSGKKHELMEKFNIDAVPYDHPDLPVWRDDMGNFIGTSYQHQSTNLIITGMVDDVWINPKSELHIVDYKATATQKEISLDDEYKQSYKNQMEIYQWLFRKNNFNVSDIGYFVYANARKTPDKFDGILEFEMQIISHKGKSEWVEPTIKKIKKCLDSDQIPDYSKDCDYCKYRQSTKRFEGKTTQGSLGI